MTQWEKKGPLNKKVKSAASEALFYSVVVVGYTLFFWGAYCAILN